MQRYPDVSLDLDFTDRMVDVIGDGYDAVVRTGEMDDSGLKRRRLGAFRRILVASPEYLRQHGEPRKAADLQRHACLHYRYPSTGRLERWPLKTAAEAQAPELPLTLVCNSVEMRIHLALNAQGIVCLPDFTVRRELAEGQSAHRDGRAHPGQRHAVGVVAGEPAFLPSCGSSSTIWRSACSPEGRCVDANCPRFRDNEINSYLRECAAGGPSSDHAQLERPSRSDVWRRSLRCRERPRGVVYARGPGPRCLGPTKRQRRRRPRHKEKSMHAAAAQPALNDIVALSAQALSDAIRQRHVSCREVMAAYLDAYRPRQSGGQRHRGAPTATRCCAKPMSRDAELAAGHWRGWLHGMPQAPDLTAVRGMVTSMGSLVFKDQVTAHDSIIAERMRAAGAIFIGRSNVPEFGLGSHTYNQVYGITRNPYDLTRSAGGSSGGAAALAARMLPVADGSDFGGSLRNPAGFCNVYGFRPSAGRVPYGPAPEVFLKQLAYEGPMGRSPRDVALMLSVLAGHDRRVPLSLTGDPAQFAQPLDSDLRSAHRLAGRLGRPPADGAGGAGAVRGGAGGSADGGLRGRRPSRAVRRRASVAHLAGASPPDGGRPVQALLQDPPSARWSSRRWSGKWRACQA